jgi:DNA primase large subunit
MWSPYSKLTSKTGRTHLKYFARMQLNLFLKGIGVKLEDVLQFWRREFQAAGLNGEQFEKEYAYNFKHQYGVAGSRIKYKPFCCQQLIQSSPVKGTCCTSGCAYKHYSPGDLQHALNGMRLEIGVVTAVMNKAREGHYQVACTMVYEARHAAGAKKEATKACVEHPNQYFKDSREYYEAKDSKDKENKNEAQEGCKHFISIK